MLGFRHLKISIESIYMIQDTTKDNTARLRMLLENAKSGP